MDDVLITARERLEKATPLKTDCGRVCGARCCRTLEGEETGMLLFPGEESAYQAKDGWRILEAERCKLLLCPGRCEREERPLSCRLFPLLPVIREGMIRAAVDQRASAVCPLVRSGIRGMDPAFIRAVKEAGEMLSSDPVQRAFLEQMTREQDELKQLRQEWGAVYAETVRHQP